MIEFGIATALLIFTIMIGIPIAFAIGITSVLYIIMTNPGNTQVMLLRMFSGVDSFILMAIPLFVLAAEIMVRSGISTKLFNFVRLFVGRMRGGLAYVNVLVSTIFGSISGAALSDIAGLGLIEIESMKEDGYEHDFACAVTAVSSVQSTLIPPSNSAVLYGGIMSISVGALFIAGLVPGLLLAASQILYIALMSKKLGLPKRDEKYTKSEVIQIIKDGFIGIMMPIIILIGILGGFFTPTEAAGIAVAYSLIIGCFVYRNIKLEDIKEALWSSVKTSGNLFIIIAFSSAFSWALGMENVPDQIANYMLGISSNPKVLLFIVNILLIIIG